MLEHERFNVYVFCKKSLDTSVTTCIRTNQKVTDPSLAGKSVSLSMKFLR